MATWTMSEARRRFRELLERAESGEPMQITRRDEIAAVVVAVDDFERLRVDAEGFPTALRRFRATTAAADLIDDELDDLRDATPGRQVAL